MKVAFAFPNKPLNLKTPSGDRTIANGIVESFERHGHLWQEMTDFRTRWFWLNLSHLVKLPLALHKTVKCYKDFRPHVWVTYHSYYKSPDIFGWWLTSNSIPYVLIQPMRARKRLRVARTKIGALINDMAIRRADMLISNNLKDLEALRVFVPEKPLCYIPPGIFPERFSTNTEVASYLRSKLSIPYDAFVLLTVSRFREGAKWKSLKFLFKSLEILLRMRKNFLLLVIGSGPMELRLKKWAYQALQDRVMFLGEINRWELSSYYSLADLFVFPGIGESLGMVYLEAQSCGCPVVALDGEGVRQVVSNGRTGILVSPEDPMAYAEAIEFLLNNPNIRIGMGEEGKKFILESHNAHVNNALLVKVIEELVMKREGSTSKKWESARKLLHSI
ncbi:MAG: glycosyltransferase family 4 protein [Syntrophobacterales bacterium]|nr:glycosyltransferase family 4 protein [Syntrophobacterales bacterium]